MLDIDVPPQGGIEVDAGVQVGDRNPIKPEGEGTEGILPGQHILKGLFLGNSRNIFNNLSRLAMLWNV